MDILFCLPLEEVFPCPLSNGARFSSARPTTLESRSSVNHNQHVIRSHSTVPPRSWSKLSSTTPSVASFSYHSGLTSMSLSSHIVPPVWVPSSAPTLEGLLATRPTLSGESSRFSTDTIVCAWLVVFGTFAESSLGIFIALAVNGSATEMNANGFAHIGSGSEGRGLVVTFCDRLNNVKGCGSF